MDYEIDYAMQTELEAAVFRRLLAHLRQHTEVQNIDLMNLAGFCRNCLGNWFAEAANERGLPLTRDDGRETVYGMPYAEWKALYQTEASPAAQDAFLARETAGVAREDAGVVREDAGLVRETAGTAPDGDEAVRTGGPHGAA